MKQLKIQTNSYTVRYEKKDGHDYIVVPVVMMREGVHNGSHGAIYHTAEELGKELHKWNGIPVTIGHPKDGEDYISANAPCVNVVGRVYNVVMDGDKLKGDAWINETKLIAVSAQAAEHIHKSVAMDVSVGVFSEDLVEEGDWNGESYHAIATNYYPDHLALLPGDTGACSWDDGCGIRANKKEESTKVELTPQNKNNNIKKLTTMSKEKMCCNELITKIIQSNQNNLTEKDREFLSALETEQVERLMPVETKPPEMEVNSIKEFISKITEEEKILELLPPNIQANVDKGLKMYAEQRKAKIEQVLKANSEENQLWTAEELGELPCEMLEKISRTVETKVKDYSGTRTYMASGGVEPMLPPGVK